MCCWCILLTCCCGIQNMCNVFNYLSGMLLYKSSLIFSDVPTLSTPRSIAAAGALGWPSNHKLFKYSCRGVSLSSCSCWQTGLLGHLIVLAVSCSLLPSSNSVDSKSLLLSTSLVHLKLHTWNRCLHFLTCFNRRLPLTNEHVDDIWLLNKLFSDCRNLVSASQDGKLIVWDGYTTNKVRNFHFLLLVGCVVGRVRNRAIPFVRDMP